MTTNIDNTKFIIPRRVYIFPILKSAPIKAYKLHIAYDNNIVRIIIQLIKILRLRNFISLFINFKVLYDFLYDIILIVAVKILQLHEIMVIIINIINKEY